MTLTLPTIHMNGTSAESLIKEWDNAFDAIEKALIALRRTAPNGRDYYLQGPDAYTIARGEHLARMDKLCEVQAELEELIGHAANYGKRRA